MLTLSSIAVNCPLFEGTCRAHNAEYGGNKFLENVNKLLQDYKHHIPRDEIV